MHSWLTRCSIGLTTSAVIGATLMLLPAPAQAAGIDVVVAPPESAITTTPEPTTTEPVSEAVKVEQTAIEPAAPANDGDKLPEGNRSAQGDGVEDTVERVELDPFQMAGVTWAASSEATDVSVRVQVRTDGNWGAWQDLVIEDSQEGRPGTEPLWTSTPADAIAVDVKAASGSLEDVKVTTIDPGKDEVVSPVKHANYEPAEDESLIEEAATDGTPSVVPMPSIITRAQWKAGAGTSCSAPRTRPKALGVTIHHTAGSNTYKKSESAGIVRSYQSYHVKGHGWCDIGYNFLVDRFGQIFEGRKGGTTNQVRAAHAGVDAVNQYATGISMMGHFDYQKPSAAQKAAVVKLTGWRLKYFGANPKGNFTAGGRSYKVIHGHRDVKATACPGKYGYAWLSEVGGLRDRVATYISKAKSAAGSPDVSNTYSTPANVKVSASTTTVQASWTAVAGAPGYRVALSADGKGSTAKFYYVTSNSATITGLTSRRDYVVRVAVFDKSAAKKRLSPYTSRPYPSVRTPAFQPVTGIKVTKRAAKGLKLTWAAQPGAPGYRVQVVKDGETKGKRYVQTYTNAAGIGKLAPGTKYRIRVAVVNPATKERFGAYTKSPYAFGSTMGQSASPAPTAPAFEPVKGIKITKRAAKGLKFSWPSQAGAPGYRVQVAVAGQKSGKRYVQTRTNSAGIGKLKPGTRYRIRVAVANPSTKARLSGYTKKPYTFTYTLAPKKSAAPAAQTFQPVSGIKVTKRASKGLKFSWPSQAGAPGYRVQVAVAGQKSGKRYVQTRTNSAGIGKLKPGTRYRIRVAVANPSTKARLSGYTKKPYTFTHTRGSKPVSAPAPAPAPAPSTAKNTIKASGGTITFKGHGYGHGIGMSQYGAEGGARAGKKYNKILARYYPGTKLATKTATIRVLISADTTNSVYVKPKSGLMMRTLGNNKAISLPSKVDGRKVSAWSIDRAKSNTKRNSLFYRSGSTWYAYRTFPADAQFEGPATIKLVMPNGSTQAFRGALRSTKPTSTSRDTVNVLSLEDYTRGVVAREMPSSWHMEALKAQSVAARTFGSRYLGSSRHYDICDTVSCQVYGGYGAESSRTNSAINATSGKILTYQGAPALTQFSSSSGGYTNVGSAPYLKPVADPWNDWSGSKHHNWSQKVSVSTIQKKYGVGTLKSLRITKRNGYGDMGGRVVSMQIKGSKSTKTITGVDARWAFGLRSDWFGF